MLKVKYCSSKQNCLSASANDGLGEILLAIGATVVTTVVFVAIIRPDIIERVVDNFLPDRKHKLNPGL